MLRLSRERMWKDGEIDSVTFGCAHNDVTLSMWLALAAGTRADFALLRLAQES